MQVAAPGSSRLNPGRLRGRRPPLPDYAVSLGWDLSQGGRLADEIAALPARMRRPRARSFWRTSATRRRVSSVCSRSLATHCYSALAPSPRANSSASTWLPSPRPGNRRALMLVLRSRHGARLRFARAHDIRRDVPAGPGSVTMSWATAPAGRTANDMPWPQILVDAKGPVRRRGDGEGRPSERRDHLRRRLRAAQPRTRTRR